MSDNLGSPKVLIVDDEPCIREMLREILTIENFEVEEAANGREAIERMNQSSIDLILLDLHMPHVNGYEFLQYLCDRQSGANDNPPQEMPHVIIVSGYLEEMKTWETALQSKVAGVLAKPFNPAKLLRLIRSVRLQVRAPLGV
ncbi:MAG: response regulator [Planctomycetes bacterium]|nr:response regulator [Planctomycetota bacterium]